MAIKSVVNTSNKRDFIETEPKVLQMAAGCPFLTQLYTTFQTRDYAGFVMEYISGGDLFDFTINHFPLDISFIRFIAVEISCGLDFLQKHVIVHRDIKGNNILLDNKGHVHIADYGVAVMDLYGDKKVTGVAGTIGYMAPELLCKCPNKRLGVSRDVRRHPFMRPIDWKSLEQGKGRPPFSVALGHGLGNALSTSSISDRCKVIGHSRKENIHAWIHKHRQVVSTPVNLPKTLMSSSEVPDDEENKKF